MSVKIMGLVWDCDLPRNEKNILLAYADHADHDGNNVYPSIGRIAWKTSYKRRMVINITHNLVKKGILVRMGEGPNGTNKYRIVQSRLPKRPPFMPEPDEEIEEIEDAKNAPPVDNGGGAKNARGGAKNDIPRAKNAPKPSINRQLESSFKRIELGPIAKKLLSICCLTEDRLSKRQSNWLKESLDILVHKINVTEKQLSDFDKFWRQSWRKGSPPTLLQVPELWGEFEHWQTTHTNGNGKVTLTAIDQSYKDDPYYKAHGKIKVT